MGKTYPDLPPNQIAVFGERHLFFATIAAPAAPGARVNLSPNGMDRLRVPSPTRRSIDGLPTGIEANL